MRNTRLLKKFTSILFYFSLILCLLIPMAMVRGKISGKQPEIFGYKFFIVLTGSMEPKLGVGELIIVKSVDSMEIKTEDIITFQSDVSNNVITHRVKEITNNQNLEFITKGDANKIDDPSPVKPNKIIGVVKGHIPRVGSLINFIQENMVGILIVIVSISTIIALVRGIKKSRVSKESKRA